MKGDATSGVIGDGEAILFEGEEIAGEEIAIFAAGEEADFGGRRVGALGEGNSEQFGDIEVDCGGGGGGLLSNGFLGGPGFLIGCRMFPGWGVGGGGGGGGGGGDSCFLFPSKALIKPRRGFSKLAKKPPSF